MAVSSYIGLSYAIAGGCLAALALIVGFGASMLLSFFHGHSPHHHGRKHHHSKFGGLIAGPLNAAEKMMDLHDSSEAHGRVLAGELAVCAYFLFFTLAALCNMAGFGALADFGLVPSTIENIYPLFTIPMFVAATFAAFSSVGAAGAAFPSVQLTAAFTGVALFLQTMAPSGNSEVWAAVSVFAIIGLVFTVVITTLAARATFTAMAGVVLVLTLVLGLTLWLINTLTFSVNLMDAYKDSGAYRWVYPGILCLAGILYLPAVFVAGAASRTASPPAENKT